MTLGLAGLHTHPSRTSLGPSGPTNSNLVAWPLEDDLVLVRKEH